MSAKQAEGVSARSYVIKHYAVTRDPRRASRSKHKHRKEIVSTSRC